MAPLLVTAALSGAAVMMIELSAVRLIAPWYGTSLAVWSNVIAVVLLGLALGYLIGARASRGRRPERHLLCLMASGAILTALTPLLTPVVADFFVPSSLSLNQAAEVFRWGSLATALCLFLAPATVLGGVGPLVTELIGRSGKLHPGDAGGRVLFASTVGSLIGVFGTSYWAIPTWGLRWTFFAAAGLLLLGCTVLMWLSRRVGLAGLLSMLFTGSLAFIDGPVAHAQVEPLAVGESLYQRVRVVEDAQTGSRFLQVNEVSNSYQSVWQPEPGFLDGDFYYNDFALPAWWTFSEAGVEEREWQVLCVGMGGGTAKRVLEGELPPGFGMGFVGIELDELVVAMAEEWFGLKPGPNDRFLVGLDGRVAVKLLEPGFDQIIVDAYANQIELPAHLCTVEFFRELTEKLAPRGWLQVNVGGASPTAPLVAAVARTLSKALDGDPVLASMVPGTRNVMLTARPGFAVPVPTGAAWSPVEWPRAVRDVQVGRAVRGQWASYSGRSPMGLILTDDRAPVERIELDALLEAGQ